MESGIAVTDGELADEIEIVDVEDGVKVPEVEVVLDTSEDVVLTVEVVTVVVVAVVSITSVPDAPKEDINN